MEDSSIWARRPRNILSAVGIHKPSVRYTWAGPIDRQLYSDSLNHLSRSTEQNKAILQRSIHRGDSAQSNNLQRQSQYGHSSLSDFGMVFAPRDNFSFRAGSATLDDDDASSVVSVPAPVNQCYLCSTLDQHHHHVQPLRSKKLPKPRISYIAPPPKVRRKMAEEPPSVFDRRYKVTVWTGNRPGASTSANVYITLKGDKNILHKTRLFQGHGKNKIFCRGAKDVFYVKSPALGNLEILTIELEPNSPKKCSWYCDKIEVMCLKTSQCWLFECNNWLSLHHGDFKTVRDLIAVHLKNSIQEFELIVTTGSKNLAGTDANVFVTFYGAKGNSPKIKLLAENSGKLFQRKSVDYFHVRFPDIGEIKTLRIEHDGTGFAPGWFLENVVMKDTKDPTNVYYFLLHGWLAIDRGDGRLWREIKATKNLAKEITSGKLVKYKVTVHTGDVRYAGTDANVYIIIEGANGKTKKLFMNDQRNNFEKGMTEEFELEAFNTGPITNVRIGHDNTGVGAGWYCENVTVKRYLPKEEQVKILNRLKKKLQDEKLHHQRRPSSDRLRKGSVTSVKSHKEKYEQDDDDEPKEDFNLDNYRDVFDHNGEVMKIPLYEEYYFECKAWLAKDEGDGLVERELEVKRNSVIFKKR